MSTVIPYDSTELKGVWIRPTFYNEKDIIKTLDQLAEAGINNIFLETYYHGKTIFPSQTMTRYGFIRQNEEFVGFDPLKYGLMRHIGAVLKLTSGLKLSM